MSDLSLYSVAEWHASSKLIKDMFMNWLITRKWIWINYYIILYLGVDDRKIINWILMKQGVAVWTGLNWRRTDSSDGVDWAELKQDRLQWRCGLGWTDAGQAPVTVWTGLNWRRTGSCDGVDWAELKQDRLQWRCGLGWTDAGQAPVTVWTGLNW
jgi:hypothetical protein